MLVMIVVEHGQLVASVLHLQREVTTLSSQGSHED